MAEMIKRTVRVTITKVLEVEFPAEWGSDENIADWRRGLWDIDGVDDIAKFGARMAATGSEGHSEDGIGLVGQRGFTYRGGKTPDFFFKATDEDSVEEIIPDGEI